MKKFHFDVYCTEMYSREERQLAWVSKKGSDVSTYSVLMRTALHYKNLYVRRNEAASVFGHDAKETSEGVEVKLHVFLGLHSMNRLFGMIVNFELRVD
jgi:hypothetical protein